jgi:exonuclease III
MDSHRTWKIINWNLRGINTFKRWLNLASKIDEFGCDIICLQETKGEAFHLEYIRNFRPMKFNKIEFLPSVGASGGLIII